MHIPVLSDNLNYFVLLVIIIVIIKVFLFTVGSFLEYVIVHVVNNLWENNFEKDYTFLYVVYSHTLEVVV